MHCQRSFANLVALCGDVAKHFGVVCRRPVGTVVKRAEVVVVVLLPSVSTDRIRSQCRRRYYFPPLFCYALTSLTFCFNRSLSTRSLSSGTSCNQHSPQLQAPGEAGLVRRHSGAVAAVSKYGGTASLLLGSIFSSRRRRRIYDTRTQPRTGRSRRYSMEQFSSSSVTTTPSSSDNMLSSPACERNREPIVQAMTPFLRERLEPDDFMSHARGGAVTEGLCAEHGSTAFPALLLEVAAGTGQHMSHIAPRFPLLKYLPTDISQSHLRSIEAYRLHGAHSNTLPAVVFDVSADWTNKHPNAQLSQVLREYYSCSDSLQQSEGLESSPSVTESSPSVTESSSRELSKVDFMYCANMIHISSNAAVDGLFRNAGLMLKPEGLLFTYGPYAFHSVIQPDSNVRFHRSLQRDNAEWGLRDIDQLKKLATCNGLEVIFVQALPANNHFVVFEKDAVS